MAAICAISSTEKSTSEFDLLILHANDEMDIQLAAAAQHVLDEWPSERACRCAPDILIFVDHQVERRKGALLAGAAERAPALDLGADRAQCPTDRSEVVPMIPLLRSGMN